MADTDYVTEAAAVAMATATATRLDANQATAESAASKADAIADPDSHRLTDDVLKVSLPELDVRAFGATGDDSTDDTAAIQAAIDFGESIGGATIFVPAGVFRFSHIELGDYCFMRGTGRGSILKQLDGITYNDGTGTGQTGFTGSYGLSCKSGIDECGVFNLALDGNYTSCTDYADDWDTLWDATNTMVLGRLKVAGLAFEHLSRTTFVAPNRITVDNVSSYNWARSCATFLTGSNPNSVVQVGRLWLANSAVDHLIYADRPQTLQIDSLVGEGYANNAMFVFSGAQIGRIKVQNLAENPNENPGRSVSFETNFVIDDRDDLRGSQIDHLTVIGDLATLTSSNTLRRIIDVDSAGFTLRSMYIEHTGTDPDLHLRIAQVFSATATAPSLSRIRGVNIPGEVTILHAPPGGTILDGGTVEDVHLQIHPDAASATTRALFQFTTTDAQNFTARDITIAAGAASGPAILVRNQTSNNFQDCSFEDIRMPGAGAVQSIASSGAAPVRVRIRRFYSTGAALSAPLLAAYDIAESVVGGTTYRFGINTTDRPVLATGGGASVDDVITALQGLGLVKQS